MQIEIRDDSRRVSQETSGIRADVLSNIASTVINRTELHTAPGECRELSPCTIQPVLIAYDEQSNVIDELGSNDQPWQVKISVVNRPNWILQGGTAPYVNGQTQFTQFALPSIGSFELQFTFIQPDGVSSSFLQTTNLTVRTAAIPVTRAILAGQQVNAADRFTRGALGKIQWGNWTWNASASLYSLPKFNRPGMLIVNESSTTTVDLSKKTVTLSNLKINVTGMYVLNLSLTSTNDEHRITLPSSAILVQDIDDSLGTESDQLLSNITFSGDYHALDASNELEIKRAMIYNYLTQIGMPLVSDLTLTNRSVVALFQVGVDSEAIFQAVSSLQSDLTAIPALSVASLNINGRSFFFDSPVGDSSTNIIPTTSSKEPEKNTGLIVGLLSAAIVVVGVILALRARRRRMPRI